MIYLQPQITGVEWTGPNSLRVRFSTQLSGYHHQLYLGRQWIGETIQAADREIVGSIDLGDVPEHLSVIAVNGADFGQDNGSVLPRIPLARLRASFQTDGWPSDTKWIEVASNTTPGGAVDDDNVIDRIPWEGVADYVFLSDPRDYGSHTFRIRGRDDKPDEGNLGTLTDLNVTLRSYPNDVQASGNDRFDVSVAAGVATLSWSL